MRLIHVLALLIPAASVGACHHALPSSSSQSACDDYARALCARMAKCRPNEAAILGSAADCAARTSLVCQSRADLADTGYTPAKLAACAGEAPDTECAVLFEGARTAGSACSALAHGTLAAGKPCLDRLQCASAVCIPFAAGTGSGCGTCAGLVGDDADCTDLGTACEDGFYCNRRVPGWRCAPAVGKDEACPDGQAMCAAGLHCIDGTCQAPLGEGQLCDVANGDPCDAARGIVCSLQGLTCVKQTIEIKQIGDNCFDDGDMVRVVACATGSFCANSQQIDATCQPVTVPEGHGCYVAGTTGGDPCMPPSSCVDGQCGAPDPPLCQ